MRRRLEAVVELIIGLCAAVLLLASLAFIGGMLVLGGLWLIGRFL